jgi:hypothetical protein
MVPLVDNCILRQLLFRKNCFQMLGDVLFDGLEQVRHPHYCGFCLKAGWANCANELPDVGVKPHIKKYNLLFYMGTVFSVAVSACVTGCVIQGHFD